MKKLSEREAWLVVHKESLDGCCGGLCCGVGFLEDAGRITETVRDRMIGKIDALKMDSFSDAASYAWPLTPEGHKKRAAWARKQAALLAKKRAK